jgi:hypothetical protein
VRQLVLTREIAELNQSFATEAASGEPTRAYLETYAAQLLKRAAELYATTLAVPGNGRSAWTSSPMVGNWDGSKD